MKIILYWGNKKSETKQTLKAEKQNSTGFIETVNRHFLLLLDRTTSTSTRVAFSSTLSAMLTYFLIWACAKVHLKAIWYTLAFEYLLIFCQANASCSFVFMATPIFYSRVSVPVGFASRELLFARRFLIFCL